MGYINQPPDLHAMFQDIEQRLRKLETATRLTAPNVDFATNTPPYPRVGDMFYDTNAEFLKYWNGTNWIEIADNNLSTTISSVNATLKTINNNIVYTGNPCVVQSQRIGKMITANAIITCTNITNFGTGQWYFELPAGFPTFTSEVIATGSIIKAGVVYTIFGVIAQGDNKMYLYHPTSNGGSDTVTYNKPVVLTTTCVITINGVAIIA